MQLCQPTNPELRQQRDHLLQQSMRPAGLYFSINDEYPIVLGSDPKFSYCLVDNQSVLAHANLWPRILFDQAQNQEYKLGLIGNVATHHAHRGQGLMTRLFNHLFEIGEQQGLDALILWSDLHKFYQRLGFASLGTEYRLFYNSQRLWQEFPNPAFQVELTPNLTELHVEEILACRMPVSWTLKRSTSEFRKLLSIPATLLMTEIREGTTKGFVVIGKGYDMAGVAHEWGVRSPTQLLQGLADAARVLEYKETILLCPREYYVSWKIELEKLAAKCEKHPMALVKNLKQRSGIAEAIQKSFIWGLDSI